MHKFPISSNVTTKTGLVVLVKREWAILRAPALINVKVIRSGSIYSFARSHSEWQRLLSKDAEKQTNKKMVIEWTAQFLSRDLFLNLSRSFSFRPARGSIYIINHKLSTTRSTNRCTAVQIRLEQSSTPTIQDYKQRVSTINWDHSIVNEDLILFSYQMHSFSLVTSCPWKESCKIIKATLQTPRTLTLRSPGTSRTPWNSKDFKAFGLTAESCPLPNPCIGCYPEAHRSYDK